MFFSQGIGGNYLIQPTVPDHCQFRPCLLDKESFDLRKLSMFFTFCVSISYLNNRLAMFRVFANKKDRKTIKFENRCYSAVLSGLMM